MDRQIQLFVSGQRQSEQLSCPLSTVTVLSLQQYLISNNDKLTNITVEAISLPIQETEVELILDFKVPVSNKQFQTVQVPAAVYQDCEIESVCTVAGLTGVCRLLAQGQITRSSNVHPEGLLGFRSSCLQAPNEVSVWTKFCEVELPDAVNYALINIDKSNVLPADFARFENHLKQPPRIHNYQKVTRDLKDQANIETTNVQLENLNLNPNKSPRTTIKKRQWKSSKKNNVDSQIIENNLEHKFAEGPYLTLADILLYPPYFVLFSHISSETVRDILPKTVEWFENLSKSEEIKPINTFLQNVTTGIKSKSETFSHFTIPNVENFSLYKCDPKRSNPRKRLFTKENDVIDAMKCVNESHKLNIVKYPEPSIDWKNIPNAANPFCGYLPDKRQQRKSQQLENLASAVIKISEKGNTIVDFCCGSGHLGILLGCLLPECTIILLENKEQSLNNAKNRVKELKLKNIQFFQCNLDFFESSFDIGVSLHACGVATDLVLEKCLKAKASFVVCPCCYGSLHPTTRLKYPKSDKFSNVSLDQYMCIGHAADQTHVDHPLEKRGSECMQIIDSDRGWHAISQGYTVSLTRLTPLSCSPKNMLLVGVTNR